MLLITFAQSITILNNAKRQTFTIGQSFHINLFGSDIPIKDEIDKVTIAVSLSMEMSSTTKSTKLLNLRIFVPAVSRT